MQFASAPSGVYTIDPGGGSFRAYCDQASDGGGWTLAMKVDGRLATFAYDAPIWENADLVAPMSPQHDHVEAKLQTFNALAFTEVRLELEYPIDSGEVRSIVLPLAATQMGELFTSGQSRTTTLGRDAWKNLIGTASSLQLNCNSEGTNQLYDFSRVRIGIVGNNEDDCLSTDSRIGVGGGGTVCSDPTQSAGNSSCYLGDNGDVELQAFAWVYIR
jgi:hypothetical protein